MQLVHWLFGADKQTRSTGQICQNVRGENFCLNTSLRYCLLQYHSVRDVIKPNKILKCAHPFICILMSQICVILPHSETCHPLSFLHLTHTPPDIPANLTLDLPYFPTASTCPLTLTPAWEGGEDIIIINCMQILLKYRFSQFCKMPHDFWGAHFI